MEPTYTAEFVKFWAVIGCVVGAAGGYVAAVYTAGRAFKKIHKIYVDELHSQYTYLLNKFGIYKKPNGEWQSHAGETISSGKEVKAYTRSDTESER